MSVQVITSSGNSDSIGFNTSYVSVQDWLKKVNENVYTVSIHHMCRFKCIYYCLLCCSKRVSIHHMCRFKTADLKVTNIASKFQYIICVGSRF